LYFARETRLIKNLLKDDLTCGHKKNLKHKKQWIILSEGMHTEYNTQKFLSTMDIVLNTVY
jgi:hypothetical protein